MMKTDTKKWENVHLLAVISSFSSIFQQRVQGLQGEVRRVLCQPHLIKHHHRDIFGGVLVLLEPFGSIEHFNDTLWGGQLAALVGKHVDLPKMKENIK